MIKAVGRLDLSGSPRARSLGFIGVDPLLQLIDSPVVIDHEADQDGGTDGDHGYQILHRPPCM
jgi:hypothetical protein